MHHTLIGAVVSIGEENPPVTWEGVWVNCVTMVLGCYETAPSRRVDAGLILAPVTVSMEWGREAGIRTGMVSEQVWYQNRCGIKTGMVSEQVWYQNRYGIRIGMVSE